MSLKNNSEDFFNKYAKAYNKARTISGGSLFNEFIEMPATEHLMGSESLAQKRILDIGCGIGAYARLYAEKCKQIVAIDVSQSMLDIAKDNCKGHDNIKFVKGSFEELEFKGKFDVILGGFMLSYFEKLRPVFKKMKSLVKKDGFVILSMLHPNKLSLKEILPDGKGFVINKYFDEDDYITDLSMGDNSLVLKKWNLQDITDASNSNGFAITKIMEPTPSTKVGVRFDEEKIYSDFPSVIVFKFKKI